MPLIVATVIIAVALVMFTVGPIFTIMAINHLFGLNIEVSLASWGAVFWLQLIIMGGAHFKKD